MTCVTRIARGRELARFGRIARGSSRGTRLKHVHCGCQEVGDESISACGIARTRLQEYRCKATGAARRLTAGSHASAHSKNNVQTEKRAK